MGTRWTVVLGVAGLLAVATALGSCATMTTGGEPRVQEHKIKIEYDARGATKQDRIKVKKDNGRDADAYRRCEPDATPPCRVGHPVDADGRPILGTITASDGDPLDRNEVFFVSDASSPGRTCVCYGNRCYCN